MPEIFRLEVTSNYSTKLIDYASSTNYQSTSMSTFNATYTTTANNKTNINNNNNSYYDNNTRVVDRIIDSSSCPYLSNSRDSKLFFLDEESEHSIHSTPGIFICNTISSTSSLIVNYYYKHHDCIC